MNGITVTTCTEELVGRELKPSTFTSQNRVVRCLIKCSIFLVISVKRLGLRATQCNLGVRFSDNQPSNED